MIIAMVGSGIGDPLDAMCELTAARTTVDRSNTPSWSAVVDLGVAGRAPSVAARPQSLTRS
jgi:hypothetical protein